MISEKKALLDISVQCATCWALDNLAKDLGSYFSTESLNMVQVCYKHFSFLNAIFVVW